MSGYVDEVVIPYDRDLGPVLFEHYGADTARRVAEQFYQAMYWKSPLAPESSPGIYAACCPRKLSLPPSTSAIR